jgi:hypothetical protein
LVLTSAFRCEAEYKVPTEPSAPLDNVERRRRLELDYFRTRTSRAVDGVEATGLEPATYGLQSRRSTN